MAERPKEFDGISVVAQGSFNPAIFHPTWFTKHNLIREEEGQDADLQVTHKEAAIFSTPWFSLQSTKDQSILTSEDPTKTQPLRDLVLGTFLVLEHTPIHAFGFNRFMHFGMESEENWHELGHFLAPKEAWDSVLEKPGMQSLTIRGNKKEMGADMILIRVEPSTKVTPGVYLHVNLHFAPEKPAKPDEMARFQSTLKNSWNTFLAYVDDVAINLFATFDRRAR